MKIRDIGHDELQLLAMLQGPKPHMDFEFDGCTSCPDYIRGIPLLVACAIHDWCYSPECTEIPETKAGRLGSDLLLLTNGVWLGLPIEIMVPIFRAVRIFGGSHFKEK